jgi:scyllo-inositol 2-dehydrogenase (NADP+)
MTERARLRVLIDAEGEDAGVAALIRYLEAGSRFQVDPSPRLRPDGHQLVLVVGTRLPDAEEVAALYGHLRAGGGMVVLGSALTTWMRDPELVALAGCVLGDLAPRSELRVHPVPGRAISARLDEEVLLTDRPWLGCAPPEAEPLITVRWRFRDEVVGFRVGMGGGRRVCLGLGSTPSLFVIPAFQQLVHRCLCVAAGLEATPTLGVGLYGYGVIGREHAEAVAMTEGLELRRICDRSPERRAVAEERHGTPTCATEDLLLNDPSVDVVVVGLPPAIHPQGVLASLAAGKHVVCEKPFAIRQADAERMIVAAERSGRVLTVYQSRRWDPDFLLTRALLDQRRIGSPFYMESFVGGFSHPCGYWHSHEPISGGAVYDWGAHYLDWALLLFPGEVVRVRASAHKRVWHDVTNADQVRVDLQFVGGEEANFLQSDIAAALKPKWYLLGTEGAIVADWRLETVKSRAWTGELVETRLQPAESPALVRVYRPGREGTTVEVPPLPARPRNVFYRNLVDHLLLGEPLAVPPWEAWRNVAVMEAATRSIMAGGREQEVRI